MIPHKNRLHVESPFKKQKQSNMTHYLVAGLTACMLVHCPPHEQLKTKHQNKRLRYDNSQYRDVCHRNQTDKKSSFSAAITDVIAAGRCQGGGQE